MKEPISFLKPLVKIGDSLCIRVPVNAIDYLELKNGDLVEVSLKIPEEEAMPKKLLLPYKKHLPELKDFSLSLINSCVFFAGLENTLDDKKKAEFEKTIEKQKGHEFLEKYRIFKNAMKNKKAMKKIVQESMSTSEDFKKSIEISTGKK